MLSSDSPSRRPGQARAAWSFLAPHLPRILASLASALLVCGGLSVASWFILSGGPTRAAAAEEVVIPPGTAQRVAAGETPPSIPDRLSFVQGDTLVLRNDDAADHRIGPYFVRSGETLSVALQQPGASSFFCSFHPGGIGFAVQSRNNPLWLLLPTLALGLPMGIVLAVVWSVFSHLDGPGIPATG